MSDRAESLLADNGNTMRSRAMMKLRKALGFLLLVVFIGLGSWLSVKLIRPTDIVSQNQIQTTQEPPPTKSFVKRSEDQDGIQGGGPMTEEELLAYLDLLEGVPPEEENDNVEEILASIKARQELAAKSLAATRKRTFGVFKKYQRDLERERKGRRSGVSAGKQVHHPRFLGKPFRVAGSRNPGD